MEICHVTVVFLHMKLVTEKTSHFSPVGVFSVEAIRSSVLWLSFFLYYYCIIDLEFFAPSSLHEVFDFLRLVLVYHSRYWFLSHLLYWQLLVLTFQRGWISHSHYQLPAACFWWEVLSPCKMAIHGVGWSSGNKKFEQVWPFIFISLW